MSNPAWTPDQQNAIDARAGTLLVSAAAGSGKTAVLVERVIRRLTDPENPCDAQNLLIVTFTNAAAAQMRDKISAAISKKIAESPRDKRLRRQKMLLPFANICTIDSFCINLVRDNFHTLGVAPDFKLLDEDRLFILKSDAVNTVVNALYEKGDAAFRHLCMLVSDSRDDEKLISAILTLHSLSQAYPYPEQWLDSLTDAFNDIAPIKQSVWGREILGYVLQQFDSYRSCIEAAYKVLNEDDELRDKYTPAFQSLSAVIDSLEKKINEAPWDEIAAAFACAGDSIMGFGVVRNYTGVNKEYVTALRDKVKKGIDGLQKYFEVSESEYMSDTAALGAVVGELVADVHLFTEEFERLKRLENGADFADTLHLALRLLVEQGDGGEVRKTPLARELSLGYEEILVDEYQDVNLAQDWIFNALSRDENNIFMVGDVKQSIYRFRQAMPEIFLARRDKMPAYDGNNYPATVMLGKNFRSREGVTETVNFIFSQAMSRHAGGLDYDEGERLVCGAKYPERSEPDAELHLVEAPKDMLLEAQAVYAANYIENAINSGLLVGEGESLRKATYKDFCILLRSVSKHGGAYAEELISRGIPVYCESEDNFFAAPETGFMLSLLRVLNNPVDDISLLTVMLSPVFGFTPDDLAAMRSKNKKCNIYSCICAEAAAGNKKCADFLGSIERLRMLSVTVSAGELVRRLLDETGYNAVVCSMADCDKRLANLRMLIDIANKYESNGKLGLPGFIRYVDCLAESAGKRKSGSAASERANAVHISTIHKSKGLEFSVCIVSSCETLYHSDNDELAIARGCGIGIRNCDEQGIRKFETLNRLAARIENRRENRSEELRVLYVALTRAKEKLVMIAGSTNVKKLACACRACVGKGERINPYAVAEMNCYNSIIVTALMRHPDAHILRNLCGAGNDIVLPCKTPLKVVKSGEILRNEPDEPCEAVPEVSEELAAEIENRLTYVYPYASLGGIVAKRIASKLDAEDFSSEYFASSIPAFMGKGSLTPAQRGTATHKFMQFADYSLARENAKDELERLTQAGKLFEAEAQAVDLSRVSAFFGSDLARRMLAADKLYKEHAFTVNIPVSEMYGGVDAVAAGETVMIEGVVDCAFEENGSLVIVDYKTDRNVTAEILVQRYKQQLEMYRRCLTETLGKPVSQLIIYSFELGSAIEVE